MNGVSVGLHYKVSNTFFGDPLSQRVSVTMPPTFRSIPPRLSHRLHNGFFVSGQWSECG